MEASLSGVQPAFSKRSMVSTMVAAMPSVVATEANSGNLKRSEGVAHNGVKQSVRDEADFALFEHESVQRHNGARREDHAITRQLVLKMADEGGCRDHDSEICSTGAQTFFKFAEYECRLACARCASGQFHGHGWANKRGNCRMWLL